MLYIPTTAHTGAAHKVEFDILFTFVDRLEDIGKAAILDIGYMLLQAEQFGLPDLYIRLG